MLVAAYSPLHVLKEQLVRQLERVALGAWLWPEARASLAPLVPLQLGRFV